MKVEVDFHLPPGVVVVKPPVYFIPNGIGLELVGGA